MTRFLPVSQWPRLRYGGTLHYRLNLRTVDFSDASGEDAASLIVLPIRGDYVTDAQSWPRATLRATVPATHDVEAVVWGADRVGDPLEPHLPFGTICDLEGNFNDQGWDLVQRLILMESSYRRSDHTWELYATDLSGLVHANQWSVPQPIPETTVPSEWVLATLSNALPPRFRPTLTVAPDPIVGGTLIDDVPFAEDEETSSLSPWESILSVCTARGVDLWDTGGGAFRMQPALASALIAADTITEGVDIVDYQERWTGGYNDVRIVYRNRAGDLKRIGQWVDNRSTSPNRVQRNFSRVTVLERRGNPAQDKADKAAKRYGVRVGGFVLSSSYDTIPLPHLEAGDTVQVVKDPDMRGPLASRAVLLQRVGHDLAAGGSVLQAFDQNTNDEVPPSNLLTPQVASGGEVLESRSGFGVPNALRPPPVYTTEKARSGAGCIRARAASGGFFGGDDMTSIGVTGASGEFARIGQTPVVPGARYRASVWVSGTAGFSPSLQLNMAKHPNDGTISVAFYQKMEGPSVAQSPDSWVRLSVELVAGELATHAWLSLGYPGTDTTATVREVYIDDPVLEVVP